MGRGGKGGNPPEATRFKKGQSGNPSGRPKNLFSVDQLKAVIGKHFRMTHKEVQEVLASSKSPTIDLIVCSAINRAIADGDIARAEYLFNRSLGKVKDVMEIVRPEPVIIKRLNGEEISLDTTCDAEGDE